MNSENFRLDDSLEDRANSWLAQFAPLVMETDDVPLETELRGRLQLIEQLAESSVALSHDIRNSENSLDSELVRTFEQACTQLPSLERESRRQLGKVSPGNPDSIADLGKLNERLAERAAREEIGALNDDPTLPLKSFVSGPNLAAAGFIGLFGTGWTCFTLVHAILMIGGMMQAFGPIALLILGFYAIFFTVGFGMLSTALKLASTESIELSGTTLTVFRKFGPWVRQKSYEIDPEMEARVDTPSFGGFSAGNKGEKGLAILMTDKRGKTISFAGSAESYQRTKLCDRINGYLNYLRS